MAHASGTPGPGGGTETPGPTLGPGGCVLSTPTAPPAGLTLFVCYRMSGQVTAQGGFEDEAQSVSGLSCSAWAAHGNLPAGQTGAVLFLPDPGDAQASVAGQPIGFYLAIGAYTGPGSYRAATDVVESATVGESVSWSTNADPKATFSAQVSADGAGSVTAANLREDNSAGGLETVTETWTCAVEPGG